MDAATLGEGLRRPGMDPRQWGSYGVVEPDGSTRSVTFDPDMGPLVTVKLQPSGIPVRCRVASWHAGAGEGSYSPFVPGDEVCVMVMEGDERAGCVIVGRMNQSLDTFPTTIAGNDVTGNTTAFLRMRPPYIVESGTALLFRIEPVGSFLSLAPDGNVTLASGDKSFLHLGADFLGLQNGDGSLVLQGNNTTGAWRMSAGGTTFLTVGGGLGQGWQSGDPICIGGSGEFPVWHAVSAETVLVWIYEVLKLVGPGLTTPIAPATLDPTVIPGLIGGFSADSLVGTLPTSYAALIAAINTPKVPATLPGVASAGLAIG